MKFLLKLVRGSINGVDSEMTMFQAIVHILIIIYILLKFFKFIDDEIKINNYYSKMEVMNLPHSVSSIHSD